MIRRPPRSTQSRSSAASDVYKRQVRAYLRPVCPLQAGVLAATGGATAMLDVSDGLLRDAARLARASGVVVRLDEPEAAFPDDWAALAPVAKGLGVDPAG